MPFKRQIEPIVAHGLEATTGLVRSVARYAPTRYTEIPTFSVDGHSVEHFIHRYNAFCPPFRMTERTVELALADMFLRGIGTRNVAEVGAVTPYYWPFRVPVVVDPTDEHEQVTDRCGWLEWDPVCDALLSMSTFEHIGAGEYGLARRPEDSAAAMDKLLDMDAPLLVTYPAGYNTDLDAYVQARVVSDPRVRVMAWHRGTRGNLWTQVSPTSEQVRRATYGPAWANTLIAIYRGPADLWSRASTPAVSRSASS